MPYLNLNHLNVTPSRILILLLTVGFLMSGCVKRDDTPLLGRSARGNGAINSIDPMLGSLRPVGTCSDSSMAVGKIYDNPAITGIVTASFRDRVALLVSASMDPAQLGTISGAANDPTGIDFSATLKFGQDGKLISDQSTLHISIFDSVALQSSGATIPIRLDFPVADSGNFDKATGTISFLFKDRFGEINFTGTSDGSLVTGVVNFKNYQSYTGTIFNQIPAVLGAFAVRACGIFN